MVSKNMLALVAFMILAMPLAFASTWTVWMDRDNPDATGDWETLTDFHNLYPSQCANPIGVECKTLSGIDYTQTGQVVSCTPSGGFYCRNEDNNQTCLDYKVRFLCSDSPNQPPVINGIGGPTSLNVGQAGTWSISAYDPDGSYLYYSINWGDSTAYSTAASTSTFQHTYSQAGTYTVSITVSDSSNASTQSTTTVAVTSSEPVCYDSDASGGYQNFNVSGYATGIDGNTGQYVEKYDTCSGSFVVDQYCWNNRVWSAYTYCPSGFVCSSGACVAQPSNQPPVITGTNGPTSISVNQQGTWGISAYDPDGTYLSYNVVWGDEAARGMQPSTTYSPTATFQHTYAQAGEYTIVFSVKDSNQAVTQATRTVSVTGGTTLQCTDSDGGVVFRIKGETKPCSASSECEVSVDSCASDGRTLREYYCSSSNANPVQSYAYVCPDGCSNGACISQLQNQAPVITSTSYPSELMVNEAGSFSIRAYDPEGGPIYAVADWGDGLSEKQESDSKAIAAGQGATFTFRHSFSSPGMQKPMFTIYDSSGMGTESSARVLVKNAQGANYFDAEVGVSPSEVAVGDNFKAFGKISYQPASELASGERKLMVVTKYLENEGRYMANKKGASLKSSEKASTSTFISPVSESEPVASIAIEKVPSDYQVRTDYITLAPGESTTITAFFTAKSLGTHKVSVEVYDITADDKSMSAAGIAGRKEPVASASTTIKVSREQPPNPPQGEMAIKLQKGWNMVSVPSEEVVTVSDIASVCDIPPHAWSYNAQSNSYQQATVLKAGYGYWIKADSDCEYKVVSPFVRTISQSLSAGWNMVGAPGSAAATSDFLGDCQVTSGPWYYSPGAGQYSYSATIKPGNAYWFKVARACTIGNWVVTPPAPPSS